MRRPQGEGCGLGALEEIDTARIVSRVRSSGQAVLEQILVVRGGLRRVPLLQTSCKSFANTAPREQPDSTIALWLGGSQSYITGS